MSISQLSPNLISQLFHNLNPDDIGYLCQTNKQLNTYCRDPQFWIQLIYINYPNYIPDFNQDLINFLRTYYFDLSDLSQKYQLTLFLNDQEIKLKPSWQSKDDYYALGMLAALFDLAKLESIQFQLRLPGGKILSSNNPSDFNKLTQVYNLIKLDPNSPIPGYIYLQKGISKTNLINDDIMRNDYQIPTPPDSRYYSLAYSNFSNGYQDVVEIANYKSSGVRLLDLNPNISIPTLENLTINQIFNILV